MRNILRLLLVSIYPIIIVGSFFYIYKKYNNTIKNKYKAIILNSIIPTLLIALGLFIFFHVEDTIYAYDYAGHWIRALTLKKFFYENPSIILETVYNSMNTSDYSYLPALFGLPLILIKESYLFFSISNLLLFLLPTFLLLNILYFHYINKNNYLPSLIILAFYPLYLTLFYGKVDCSGLFFTILAYSLVILPDFEDINTSDNILVNICLFLAIFLRRWYLYSAVCLYLSYFIKWLFYKNKRTYDLLKLISSGIILLVIVLLFFNGFLTRVLTNNFDEAYAFYNHPHKISSFINYISPIIMLISLVGLLNTKKELLIINIISIVIPCLMIWKIQSFEFHHYYVFLFNLIVLFTNGLLYLTNINNKISFVAVILLLIQSIGIYFPYNIPLFTNIKKQPEILGDKNELIELSEYIKSIEPDENTTAFLATGTYGIITDDLLRNALLPNLDGPNIDSAVFDIRDGFPRDYQFIKYIITSDPITYTDQKYQHMFNIISDAIVNNEEISSIYNPIYSTKLYDTYTITIYEKVGEYTPTMKEYFYNQMLKRYPDKADYFSYILD